MTKSAQKKTSLIVSQEFLLPFMHLFPKGGEAASISAFPAWGRGTASAVDRVLSYAPQMRLSFSYTTFCLSCHSHPIRPCGAPSPRGEGYDTRIPSSKRRRNRRPVRPSAPPYRHPERSPRSLLHCRHMHTCPLTQTTPCCLLFRLSLAHDLQVCKKDPSASALMTHKKDESSHIVFHTAT